MTVITPRAEELSPGQARGLSLGHVGPPPYRRSRQGWEGSPEARLPVRVEKLGRSRWVTGARGLSSQQQRWPWARVETLSFAPSPGPAPGSVLSPPTLPLTPSRGPQTAQALQQGTEARVQVPS